MKRNYGAKERHEITTWELIWKPWASNNLTTIEIFRNLRNPAHVTILMLN